MAQSLPVKMGLLTNWDALLRHVQTIVMKGFISVNR